MSEDSLTLWSITVTASVAGDGEPGLRYELDGDATIFELLVALKHISHMLHNQLDEHEEDEA